MVSGVIVGALFGAVAGPITARMNRRFREAAGYLPPGQLGRAIRLARRGPVPEDLELRRAARRISEHQLSQLRSQGCWLLPLLGLTTAFLLWIVLRDGRADPFSWLVIVLLLVLIAAHLLLARRLARRAELLADPAEDR